MSQVWMSHVSRMNESCLTSRGTKNPDWVMSHVWMSHVSHMNESCLTYEWVMTHEESWLSHIPHMNESCLTCEWVMTHIWIRCVTLRETIEEEIVTLQNTESSPVLRPDTISCATFLKLATNYRALLRKMTYKDKASYESSPPSFRMLRASVCEILRPSVFWPKTGGWVFACTTSRDVVQAKTHRMPYLYRSFSAKEPYN